ncbi:MAG: hypothetical protein ACREXR_09870 [Gammaproteobacteria bacterium]
MRTNIDDDLLVKAAEIAGTSTKRSTTLISWPGIKQVGVTALRAHPPSGDKTSARAAKQLPWRGDLPEMRRS